MADAQRSLLFRYGIAVISVLFAFLLMVSLKSLISPLSNFPFALFYIAVMVSTAYGGRASGLFATLCSALCGGYFVFAFGESPARVSLDLLLQMGIFISVALLIVALSEVRRTAEAAAYEDRERLRIAISAISDAVIATDRDGRITFMNGMASSLTGWELKDALGKPSGTVFAIIDAITREQVSDPVPQLLASGEMVCPAKSLVVARGGAELPIDLRGAPITSPDGEVVGVLLVFHDISGRKKTEEALVASEERYRELFENANDMLYTLDLEGNLTSINRMGESLLGRPRNELLGKPINNVVLPEDLDRVQTMLERKLAGEPETTYELDVESAGGRRLVLEISSRLIVEDGQPVGVQGNARDVAERKRAEKEREHLLARERAARAEAEAANRAKDEFLATVSHELRTPLSAILGWAHMLRYSKLDEATVHRAYETIERNARSQTQIVEDILDVSRIVTGKLRLDVMPIELAPVLESAAEAVRPAADAKGIQVEASFDRSAGPVSADPNRIQQVIWNLLSNAVKFTPSGGRIAVTLTRSGSEAVITVSDNGQGISPDFLPYVFERFRQADSTTTRKHSGLGLGLAIVRYLVEMHGGSINAASQGEGLGSTFTVRIPLSMTVADTKLERRRGSGQLPQPVPSLSGLRLLVVEDEPDTREVLRAMLCRYGAEVITCTSAEEALRKLQETQPHVLLSDIEMPVEDGYELIRKVRALEPERGGAVPAIALTAYGRVDDRLKSLSSGYQLHISKPVGPDELAALVASLANRVGVSSHG
jgi:PAS domain S-box-containing protein